MCELHVVVAVVAIDNIIVNGKWCLDNEKVRFRRADAYYHCATTSLLGKLLVSVPSE